MRKQRVGYGRELFMETISSSVWAVALALVMTSSAQAHDFKIVGNSDQVRQIEQSLSNCPSLSTTLDGLTKSANFQQIRVTTPDETKSKGPFLAEVAGNEIVVADTWLSQQNTPVYDVRQAGEILPDNLCFDLGHLSDHIAHPSSMTPTGPDMGAWVDARLKAESLAFIRAWPFVLEAARAKNNGKQLSVAQLGALFINLRYRFVFLKAMAPSAMPKLTVLPDGSIPETDANVAAIQAVLARSPIADLQ